MSEPENDKQLTLRGMLLREDERGWICLDDLWSAAKASNGKKPKFWRITEGAKALVKALRKKVGIPNLNPADPRTWVIYSGRGRGKQGTFAHPILAAAYAGYISPALEVEVREVWLRYRAGDATLADEILQRASTEANQWAGVRALSRARRNSYTDTLKAHRVEGKGYMHCTEAVYMNLLGGKSFQLRNRMGLPEKANLRDHLSADKLAYLMAAESLSAERIAEEGREGNVECAQASAISASAIRQAIEADRQNRQRKIL
jgi:hypothetical protein